MNKTYPGQSKQLASTSIGITVVGSPIFRAAGSRRVMICKFNSTISSTLKSQPSATTINYNVCEEFVIGHNDLQDTTLFKGYDQQRPGFSKPGLI